MGFMISVKSCKEIFDGQHFYYLKKNKIAKLHMDILTTNHALLNS